MARRDFPQVVIELLGDSGATVLFSSHQFADIERLAQRIGIIHEGRLLCDTTLADLQENASRVLVRNGNGIEARLRSESRCLIAAGALLYFLAARNFRYAEHRRSWFRP